jgi:Domain of unknown function (DUF4307)
MNENSAAEQRFKLPLPPEDELVHDAQEAHDARKARIVQGTQEAADASSGAGAELAGEASLAERYGVKSGMSRTRKITLGLFGFALLCGVVGYIAYEQANPQIQANVISYNLGDRSVTVTFQVNKAAGQSVECTIEAEDVQGNVIGSANVSVPAGRAQEDMVYTVNTTGTVNTAVVSSCTAS